MRTIRPAAVAGTFYPADPAELQDTVTALLADAEARLTAGRLPHRYRTPRALIAPHAGYAYSGPIAATALGRLRGAAAVRRVVLIGPSHFVTFAGLALPAAAAFAGPLGPVSVDAAAVEQLDHLPYVRRAAEPHAREHCLEVELPFLQAVLGEFEIVPLVTGRTTPEQVAEVIDLLTPDPDSVVIVSSDLSHYHPYEEARERDRRTAAAITELRPNDLAADSACGRLAIQGLLHVARRRSWDVSLHDLRNSGDTAGPRREVVGYGAFALG